MSSLSVYSGDFKLKETFKFILEKEISNYQSFLFTKHMIIDKVVYLSETNKKVFLQNKANIRSETEVKTLETYNLYNK